MAGNVKLPVIGEVKTSYAIAGVVITGGIVGYAYYKRRQSGASLTGTASAADTTSGIDPATGFPYGSAQDQAAIAAQGGAGSVANGIDPNTGFLYGSPEDTAALETQDGLPVTAFGTPSPAPAPTPVSTVPATNAEWSQEVQAGLEALGYNPRNISGALGAYLDRKPLNSNQANIIQIAVAEFGNPPQGTFQIKAGTGNGNHPAKHGKGVKQHYTKGEDSLHKFAESVDNTEAQIISLTNSHHKPQAKFNAYVQKGNFNARMPVGIDLYYEKYEK